MTSNSQSSRFRTKFWDYRQVPDLAIYFFFKMSGRLGDGLADKVLALAI